MLTTCHLLEIDNIIERWENKLSCSFFDNTFDLPD